MTTLHEARLAAMLAKLDAAYHLVSEQQWEITQLREALADANAAVHELQAMIHRAAAAE